MNTNRSLRFCSLPLLLLAGCLLQGCAFKDIPVVLPTAPLQQAVPGGNGRQVVIAIPFLDKRPFHGRCGMQKNGYNMDTANAVCQSDPNVWIAERLAAELARSGFTVLTPDEEHRASAVKLNGSLLTLFIEPVIGWWSGSLEADLSVKLRATSNTGLAAERRFFVKGWKGGTMVSTAQPYATALHRASQELVEEVVRAVIELFDKYPQLGQHRAAELVIALSTERER